MLGNINTTHTSHVSAIQLLNAANAFKNTSIKPVETMQPEVAHTSSGVDLNDDSILQSQDVEEIKKFAQMAGENDLTNDDIKYGLSYGRSVIVEYLA